VLLGAVLFVHSWLRWAILVLAIALVVRAARAIRAGDPWKPSHERHHRGLVGVVDLQFLLGVLLYVFLSPLPRALLADVGGGMKDASLRFFGVEHVFGMVISVALLHVGRARSKRAGTDRLRHRRALGWTLGSLLILVGSIPWPGLPQARPLARGPSTILPPPPPPDVACPPAFRERCVSCHGAGGRGDGPSASSIRPPPRDFTRSGGGRSDAQLRSIIESGGSSMGLSPAMPAHPDLDAETLDALVACVRSFEAASRSSAPR
jgi:hypothetical protein